MDRFRTSVLNHFSYMAMLTCDLLVAGFGRSNSTRPKWPVYQCLTSFCTAACWASWVWHKRKQSKLLEHCNCDECQTFYAGSFFFPFFFLFFHFDWVDWTFALLVEGCDADTSPHWLQDDREATEMVVLIREHGGSPAPAECRQGCGMRWGSNSSGASHEQQWTDQRWHSHKQRRRECRRTGCSMLSAAASGACPGRTPSLPAAAHVQGIPTDLEKVPHSPGGCAAQTEDRGGAREWCPVRPRWTSVTTVWPSRTGLLLGPALP